MRPGTCPFLRSRAGVTGHVIAPSAGPTRTETDCLAHGQGGVATDPQATRGHCVVDNLDIHRSASLVQWVAEVSGLACDVGEKGQHGLLATRQSRAALVSDASHRIVCHDTPKQCSWLTQSAIWLRIVGRKLLPRGSFLAVEDLKARVLAFIAYYNRTMANPCKGTSQGKPLTV